MELYLVPAAFALCALSLGIFVADFLTASNDRFQAQLDAESASRDASARVIRAVGTAFARVADPFPSLTEKLDRQLTFAGRPYGGVNGQQYLAAAIILSVLVWGYAMMERSVITLVSPDLLPAAPAGTFAPAGAPSRNNTRRRRTNEPAGGILAEEKHS